jgi:ribonuclease HI
MYALRFDGLFRGLPGKNGKTVKAGIMCYGWLISQNNVVIAQGHGAFAHGSDASSNVAEYLALIEGLDALYDLGVEEQAIKVLGDSKTVIEQMRGIARVNSEGMWPLFLKARRLAKRFAHLRWVWTPRKNNKEADKLTRRAMKQVRSDQSTYQATLRAITPGKVRGKTQKKFLPVIDLRIYQPQLAGSKPNFRLLPQF